MKIISIQKLFRLGEKNMLLGNIILYGDTANKILFLRDNTVLFERFLDVYMAAGVVGIIFNHKGEDIRSDNERKIFAEQLNVELTRIKYLASLAFLVEKINNYEEEELLRVTFGDWFASQDIEEISDDKNKYKLFHQYAIGGIDILYNAIVGESTNKEDYNRNFYKFIQNLENVKVNDNLDRAIVGALLG